MSQPIRENLELSECGGKAVIRCTGCGHVYCNAGEDWTARAHKLLLPPSTGGPPMAELEGMFLYEQLVCPSCFVLLETRVVEEEASAP